MTIQEYLVMIQKNFAYLFKERGFKVAFTKEIRVDHNTIGLESNDFRMLFEQERGSFSIFIGGHNAPFYDNDAEWVSLFNLLDFLLENKINWSVLEKYSYLEKTEIMFSMTAKEFMPLYSKAAQMFSSPNTIAQWTPSFNEYIREKVKKRFRKDESTL